MKFVDTNVLLYAVSRDSRETDKSARARAILATRDIGLSVQVLQEFYVQATRATRPDRLSHEQAAGLVESFTRFAVQETTIAVTRAALDTRERYGISYWDAAMLEASRALGCRVVLTEDLAHGQDYGGVRAENPFRR